MLKYDDFVSIYNKLHFFIDMHAFCFLSLTTSKYLSVFGSMHRKTNSWL
jgi:hypothetical protein